ncbi:conjugal transfer pilus assembly protein TraW [Alphaproteobacteria bacterium]
MARLSVFMVVLFFIQAAYAHDFGVVGNIWDIAENDPIEIIKARLVAMEKTGELEEHNMQIKGKVTQNVKYPPALNIPKTTNAREYYFNPSITVIEDLTDHTGQIFHTSGTQVNPLDNVSLPYELVFFDGQDTEQVNWALRLL